MGPKVSRETIKNTCYNIVSETQTQIVKIITQSSVNISNSVLQQQTATINSSTNSGNTFTGARIVLLNGAKLNIQQINQLKVTVGAILNIVQDNSIVNGIQTQIHDDIMSSISQNADLANKINAAAQIEKEQKTDGELNNMIDKLTEPLDKLFSIGGSKTQNDIENTIINSINETTYNSTDIENYVNNIISTKIEQQSINQCFQSNNAYNITSLRDVYLSGANTTLDIVQTNIINNYYSCFVSSSISSSDLQNLAAGILNQSTETGSQGASVKDDFSSSLSNVMKTLVTSFADNIQYIIIAVVICVILGALIVIGGPIAFKMLSKKNQPQSMNNIQSPPIAQTPSQPPKAPYPSPVSKPMPTKISTAIKNYKNMRNGYFNY